MSTATQVDRTNPVNRNLTAIQPQHHRGDILRQAFDLSLRIRDQLFAPADSIQKMFNNKKDNIIRPSGLRYWLTESHAITGLLIFLVVIHAVCHNMS